MLKVLTKKLRNQSLSEIPPFHIKISYPPSDEGDSEDSEGENRELAQIDKERRRNGTLTPLATSQLHNQRCCQVRSLFHAGPDHHSSEEELERIAVEKRKWSPVSRRRLGCHGDNTSSSDEEVKHLCAASFRPAIAPSPVLFSASPPKRPQGRKPPSLPLIFTSMAATLERATPCKRRCRPSLDLEKMQQKMLLKKNCGSKTRVIKIRSLGGGRQPPHYIYDPAMFAFRSLSTLKPISPMEEPSCAY